ncbi:hypothetical protein [Demequina aurantiaca]|uniref:hypothetical protein n=1 Tax=Demequina aurantiaca TaxID=676200 RepID=UPI003D32C526
MIATSLKVLGMGLVGLTVVALAACTAPPQNGPLVGPRSAAGAVVFCAPARDVDAQKFYAESLTNLGTDSIEILDISGSGQSINTPTYGLDLEAKEDELLGSWWWPSTGEPGVELAMKRMTAPVGVIIEPGHSVELFAGFSPTEQGGQGSLEKTVVEYASGGTKFREEILVHYQLREGDGCEK